MQILYITVLNVKTKISIIVGIQIALIVSSFLMLVYLESEWVLLADSIDVAGLNRYLTSNVILAVHDSTHDIKANPKEAMNVLKENIYFLKDGGKKDNIVLRELPKELDERWNKINEKYIELEKSVAKVMALEEPTVFVNVHEETEVIAKELVKESDIMVKDLTDFTEKRDKLLISLQIVLLIVNTTVHVGFVVMIFRILNKESQEMIQKEKLATIGEIGASLAHDIRNPLSVIKGSAELLKTRGDDKIDDFHAQQFTKIENAVERITHQTRDVLDFVKTKPIKKEKISCKKIVEKSLQNLKIPENVKIFLPENDEEIFVDKTQFEVLITNLILNALHAIDKVGHIKIKVKKTDAKVVLEFEDSGPGIPDEILSKIFESLVTTKQEGTGLGLVSCKRIVKEHGGKITVKNNPTTFTVELPIS